MAIAKGINKTLAYKLQSGLGVAASGAGGTALRRVTGMLDISKATYSNNEIATHQQHVGDIHGIASTAGSVNGNLSGATYKDMFASVLRKVFTATAPITGAGITIAGSGPYTITRAAGDFLAGGIKIGDVIQLSAGAFNANNLLNNILVTGVTATVLTCLTVNSGATLTAEGPISGSTVTVIGKKTIAPLTGHTNDYYTFEEWYSDIARSHLFPDVQIASADITIPATGIVTSNFALVGLGGTTQAGAQVLTGPTGTTSSVVSSVSGFALVGGTRYATITTAQVKIDGQVAPGEAAIGSNTIADTNRGHIKVSGQFSATFDADTLATPFINETLTSLVLVLADSRTNNANFVSLSMPAVKLFSMTGDDGEKQIVRTYSFVAQINAAGGAALANDQTIISIQDSLA
jgi:hypothetical protein